MKMSQIETLLAFCGIAFFMSPFPTEIVPSSLVSLYRYGVWGLSTLFVLIYHRRALFVARCDLFLWGVVALQLLSFIWSINPAHSIDKGREVIQMATFSLFVATRFNLKQQVEIIAASCVSCAVLSLLLGLAMPGVGIHGFDHPGAWKGIFDYKNTLGSYMVLGASTCYLIAIDREAPFKLAWLGAALCSVMTLLSTSKTALVGMFLSLGVAYLTQKFRWRGRLAVILIDFGVVVATTLGGFITVSWVRLLAGLGKDPTLTGRIPMWNVMISYIQERPILGYGRAAFFGPGSPYPAIVGRAASESFVVPHAHNGFIELALDVGLLGLGLFIVSFLIAYFRSVGRAFVHQNAGDLWPVVLFTLMLFNNITESFLLRMTSIYWVMFVTTALTLAKPQRQRQPELLRSPTPPPTGAPAL